MMWISELAYRIGALSNNLSVTASSEESNANGLRPAGDRCDHSGSFTCHRAKPKPSERRLQARTPEMLKERD